MGEPKLPNTKDRAERIDPRYIRRTQPWRRARRWLVAVFCCAVLIWLGVSSFQRGPAGNFVFTAMAHSPGHVSAAHAMIENDCIKCHDGDGHGGFVQTVSDSACLKCHDAGIHSANQTTLKASVTPVSFTPAERDVHTADVHGGMRSSDCVHCHTEHHGEAALLATDNSFCIECHLDLKSHFEKTSAGDKAQTVMNRVTAFDGMGDHPQFGMNPDPASDLKNVSGVLSDGTRLKFNHAFHNTVPGLKNNCFSCHTPMSPPAEAQANGPRSEPQLLAGDRPLSAAVESGHGDMQPISFERNCVQCHKLELAAGLSVSHREMAVVRGELASIPALIASQTKLSKSDFGRGITTPAAAWDAKIKTIVGKCAFMPSNAATSAAKEAAKAKSALDAGNAQPTVAGGKNQLSDLETLEEKAAALQYLSWLTQAKPDGKTPLLASTKQVFGAAPPYQTPDPNKAEIYVAFYGSSACNFCHTMNGGDVPAGFQYKLSLAAASKQPIAPAMMTSTSPAISFMTTQPSTQPTLLDIVPTGIPKAPRRWFANSHFDHAAHRDVSCFNCHANAWTSIDTSDFLSPNIDSSNLLLSAAERKENKIQSCIDCHGPPQSPNQLSAPSDCVTCHVYHDRTKEDPMGATALKDNHPGAG